MKNQYNSCITAPKPSFVKRVARENSVGCGTSRATFPTNTALNPRDGCFCLPAQHKFYKTPAAAAAPSLPKRARELNSQLCKKSNKKIYDERIYKVLKEAGLLFETGE